ncbi:MAG: ferrous iron transport protein A [Candidatus Saganbacteria bacterium]|nr:ferrous iron transport protein A [Candidatus Saganbacteria bacterium]
MAKKMIVSLAEMRVGEGGLVAGFAAGRGAAHRFVALGIRVGRPITKKSRGLFGGPVIVQAGGTQIGLGRGMARKVMVEVER